MLIDLLNSSNYIMVNRNAINILGLNAAVYCAELLNIYKKAVKKKAWYHETYFKVDRDYIKEQTSLEISEQCNCDINLSKVNILKIYPENPDIVEFNVETFASLLAAEDVKILETVKKKVKVENPKTVKKTEKERIIAAIKDSIECKDCDVLFALKAWVDSLFESGKCLSKVQVGIFTEKLDAFCKGNKQLALQIVEIATVRSYIDCDWAINAYQEKNKRATPFSGANFPRPTNTFTTANTQKTTVAIGKEIF